MIIILKERDRALSGEKLPSAEKKSPKKGKKKSQESQVSVSGTSQSRPLKGSPLVPEVVFAATLEGPRPEAEKPASLDLSGQSVFLTCETCAVCVHASKS